MFSFIGGYSLYLLIAGGIGVLFNSVYLFVLLAVLPFSFLILIAWVLHVFIFVTRLVVVFHGSSFVDTDGHRRSGADGFFTAPRSIPRRSSASQAAKTVRPLDKRSLIKLERADL